jgi:signal-transduction protein with cAMP-binding, CBS, and nucleotidyltransferase domain
MGGCEARTPVCTHMTSGRCGVNVSSRTIGAFQTLTEQRLPVVENGRLVGMVAQADIALKENEKRTGELVEAISESSEGERR